MVISPESDALTLATMATNAGTAALIAVDAWCNATWRAGASKARTTTPRFTIIVRRSVALRDSPPRLSYGTDRAGFVVPSATKAWLGRCARPNPWRAAAEASWKDDGFRIRAFLASS